MAVLKIKSKSFHEIQCIFNVYEFDCRFDLIKLNNTLIIAEFCMNAFENIELEIHQTSIKVQDISINNLVMRLTQQY